MDNHVGQIIRFRAFVLLLILIGAMLPQTVLANGSEVIDTLDYFVTKHTNKGLTGSHAQSQTVIGQTSYYTKWSDNAYEVHTWDNDFIYLKEDRSWKAEEAYAFTTGRWLKRHMQVGESIVETQNIGYYFNSRSCQLQYSAPLPYIITLEARIPQYFLGGDIGIEDVIVVKYDYATSVDPGNFERFYYSKDWGWVKWELYQNQKLVQVSIFNQIQNNPTQPDYSTSCTRSGKIIPGLDTDLEQQHGLFILTNKVVTEQGSLHSYYITNNAYRVYICDQATLERYGANKQSSSLLAASQLKAYPLLHYFRVHGNNSVFAIEGETVRPVSANSMSRLRVSTLDIPVFDIKDFSCYNYSSTPL